ncbi:MAG: alpha/beta hydrolase fold protein [Gemmatimonadetes bacterium]|jgi:2-hydroxy-6-oxonona-2,4-dienedioate hydrolase|nr:alpha/beta hydrolase fold protein [Gemmatimonadota bacterium]
METDLAGADSLTSVWDVIDGVRIHGRVNGRIPGGAGHPIVFVHGLGVSTRYMEPTMRLLAAGQRVAAPDLPGFGRSGSPSHVLSLPELAEVLLRWLDARGLGPAVFVGNSFGCQVILEAVGRDPARAVGLVLNAPTMDPNHRSAVGQILRVIADIPNESLRLAWIVTRDYLRAGPVRIFGTLRHALADRIEAKLAALAMPVSILCGALDPVVRVEWASDCARLVGSAVPGAPGAVLHVVRDGSHALPFDEPEEVAALVVALLDRIAESRAAGSGAA